MPNDMSPLLGHDTFSLTSFLEGRTRAWGVFEDRFGRVKRRFEVEMRGVWQGDTFVLDERFLYDDGRQEDRVWRVVNGPDGSFTATCADCIGGARGITGEGRVEMSYRFRLRLRQRTLEVDFHDRLYRIDERRAVNRATMRKWGIKLGELSLFFERIGPAGERV